MTIKKGISNTKFIVTVGIFSAMAVVLQIIGSILNSVGISFSGFLEIEISDLPPLILSLAYGPLSGVFIELIKNIIHFFLFSGSPTALVGEVANFTMNSLMCVTAGLIYKYNRTYKGAIISLISGALVMTFLGTFINFFALIPICFPMIGYSERLSLVISAITPFNFVKGIVLSIITFLLYKRISKVIK